MKDILLVLFILTILLPGQNLLAQQSIPLSFTLKGAQDYAVENNNSVKNARIDMELAKKRIWETAAAGLPQVSATANYQHIFVVPEISFPGTVISSTRNNNTLYGVEVAGDSLFMNTSGSPPIKLGVQDNFTLDLNVTQLIFSGSYLVGLQAARIFKEFTEQNMKITERDMRESVANTYYLILNLEQNAKILSESEINLRKILSDMREMLAQGFIENTDVSQIEVTLLNLENSVKTIQRQINASYGLLKFQLNIPLDSEVKLGETLDKLMEPITLENVYDQPFNVENNITYQMLSTQERLGEMNVKLSQTGYLPNIAGFYRHSEKLRKADFDFFMKDIAGVSVNIPIFSSGQRRTMVSERRLELDKMRNNKAQATEGLKLEFINAQNNYQTAYAKYLNEKKNIELSKKIYEKTLLKYKEGISSSMDLTNAHNQYLNAQSNYSTSVFSLLSAKTKIDKLLSNL
jgi:outer membrane protein